LLRWRFFQQLYDEKGTKPVRTRSISQAKSITCHPRGFTLTATIIRNIFRIKAFSIFAKKIKGQKRLTTSTPFAA
jgi:hypothetical protein